MASKELKPISVRLTKNTHFQTFDIWSVLKRRSNMVPTILDEVVDIIESLHSDVPQGVRDYHFGELKEAFQKFSEDPYLGLYTLRVDDSTRVPLSVQLTRPTELDPSATYLLVGGLGGLGRTIAELWTDGGAKHIAFFSRSGASPRAQAFIDLLASKGVNARVFAVDICDEKAMTSALRRMDETMPKIKGAVQCAAVLTVGPPRLLPKPPLFFFFQFPLTNIPCSGCHVPQNDLRAMEEIVRPEVHRLLESALPAAP